MSVYKGTCPSCRSFSESVRLRPEPIKEPDVLCSHHWHDDLTTKGYRLCRSCDGKGGKWIDKANFLWLSVRRLQRQR